MAARMVQCPNCKAILQEPPPGNPYYKCGSCFTVLQAKHATLDGAPPGLQGEPLPEPTGGPYDGEDPDISPGGGGQQHSWDCQYEDEDEEEEEEDEDAPHGIVRQHTLPSRLPARRQEEDEYDEQPSPEDPGPAAFTRQMTLPSIPSSGRAVQGGATEGGAAAGPRGGPAGTPPLLRSPGAEGGRGRAAGASPTSPHPASAVSVKEIKSPEPRKRNGVVSRILGFGRPAASARLGGSGGSYGGAGAGGGGGEEEEPPEFRRQKTLPVRLAPPPAPGAARQEPLRGGGIARDKQLTPKLAAPAGEAASFLRQATLPANGRGPVVVQRLGVLPAKQVAAGAGARRSHELQVSFGPVDLGNPREVGPVKSPGGGRRTSPAAQEVSSFRRQHTLPTQAMLAPPVSKQQQQQPRPAEGRQVARDEAGGADDGRDFRRQRTLPSLPSSGGTVARRAAAAEVPAKLKALLDKDRSPAARTPPGPPQVVVPPRLQQLLAQQPPSGPDAASTTPYGRGAPSPHVPGGGRQDADGWQGGRRPSGEWARGHAPDELPSPTADDTPRRSRASPHGPGSAGGAPESPGSALGGEGGDREMWELRRGLKPAIKRRNPRFLPPPAAAHSDGEVHTFQRQRDEPEAPWGEPPAALQGQSDRPRGGPRPQGESPSAGRQRLGGNFPDSSGDPEPAARQQGWPRGPSDGPTDARWGGEEESTPGSLGGRHGTRRATSSSRALDEGPQHGKRFPRSQTDPGERPEDGGAGEADDPWRDTGGSAPPRRGGEDSEGRIRQRHLAAGMNGSGPERTASVSSSTVLAPNGPEQASAGDGGEGGGGQGAVAAAGRAADMPFLPPPEGPQVVKCRWCSQMLAVPPNLPAKQGKKTQKLRCGKCMQVSEYALPPPLAEVVMKPGEGHSPVQPPLPPSFSSPDGESPPPDSHGGGGHQPQGGGASRPRTPPGADYDDRSSPYGRGYDQGTEEDPGGGGEFMRQETLYRDPPRRARSGNLGDGSAPGGAARSGQQWDYDDGPGSVSMRSSRQQASPGVQANGHPSGGWQNATTPGGSGRSFQENPRWESPRGPPQELASPGSVHSSIHSPQGHYGIDREGSGRGFHDAPSRSSLLSGGGREVAARQLPARDGSYINNYSPSRRHEGPGGGGRPFRQQPGGGGGGGEVPSSRAAERASPMTRARKPPVYYETDESDSTVDLGAARAALRPRRARSIEGQPRVPKDTFARKVKVNGRPVADYAVEKAEERAGPVSSGSYWYDIHAGFWGVMGGPCLGITMPGVKEFGGPLAPDCAGGDTRVFVNGRELHHNDLRLLARRGLPPVPDSTYTVDIGGRVMNESNGFALKGLGKLAPSLEQRRRGTGMYVPG